jgi:ferredoxin--NADP+ reductase
MAKTLEYNATLVAKIDISDTLAIFRVKPDEPPPPGEGGRWFIPGQYMVIGLNNEEVVELGGVRRPMSIASPPQDHEVIDFYIKYVKHPESDNPHHGIGDDDPRMRVLVGAGTGMAPFICMVDDEIRQNPDADLSKWGMMHGVSYPVELGYRDRLEKMASHNKLPYLPTVSRPKEAPDWEGPTGRVEDFFKPERLDDTEKRLGLEPGGLTPENAAIFICGLNGTIKETLERLLPRGFVPDHRRIRKALEIDESVKPSLFFEQYDNTPIIDVKDPAEVERIKALYRPVG